MKTIQKIFTKIDKNKINSLSVFLFIRKKFPEAFFFESKERTIIGLKFEKRIEIKNSKKQFFENIEFFLNENRKRKKENYDFPYSCGGIFGCIGYEMVLEVEPILNKKKYFKALNNKDLAYVFLSRDLIIFEKNPVNPTEERIRFVLTHFNLSPEDLFEKSGEISNDHRKGRDFSFLCKKKRIFYKSFFGKKEYFKNVKKIQENIKNGEIFQAVLAETFKAKVFSRPEDLFFLMRKKTNSDYSFYFEFSKKNIFFGNSPDMFLKIKGKEIETHPIAGTKRRGNNAQKDNELKQELIRSIKENAEHLMLLDLARNDIGRVSEAGTVQVKNFKNIINLSHVRHFSSRVIGLKKNNHSSISAFKSCFPAGTLSGAPKVRAIEILSEIEKKPRGLFGGAVIALDLTGDLDSCIAIRAVEYTQKKKFSEVTLKAGAGIVFDSKPKEEYQEIKNKLEEIFDSIAYAEYLTEKEKRKNKGKRE